MNTGSSNRCAAIADTITLDCGDQSCLFTSSKTGMRTNGGCRCFDMRGLPVQDRHNLTRLAQLLRCVRETRDDQ